MFLTHWTLGFDPDMEISIALEWVKLPYLPIIFWDESFLKDIRNKQCRLTFRGGKTLNLEKNSIPLFYSVINYKPKNAPKHMILPPTSFNRDMSLKPKFS